MQCSVRDERNGGRYMQEVYILINITRGSAFDIHNPVMSSNIEKIQNTRLKKFI
jgi:hypothetical protein